MKTSSSNKDLPHSKELEQLDALLSKAQKLFKSKETKRPNKSIKAASVVYGAGSQSTNRTKSTHSSGHGWADQSRSKPRSKVSGGKHSVAPKVHPSEAKKEAKDVTSRQDEKVPSVALQEEDQSFLLAKQG